MNLLDRCKEEYFCPFDTRKLTHQWVEPVKYFSFTNITAIYIYTDIVQELIHLVFIWNVSLINFFYNFFKAQYEAYLFLAPEVTPNQNCPAYTTKETVFLNPGPFRVRVAEWIKNKYFLCRHVWWLEREIILLVRNPSLRWIYLVSSNFLLVGKWVPLEQTFCSMRWSLVNMVLGEWLCP